MIHSDVSATVIRHISEIESAVEHINDRVDVELGKRIADVIESTRQQWGWNGKVANDLDQEQWIGPSEWKVKDDDCDGYDLCLQLGCFLGAGDVECKSWIGTLCGCFGTGLEISLHCGSLGKIQTRKLFKESGRLMESLAEVGVRFNVNKVSFGIPLVFDKEELALAFEKDDFETALLPISNALKLLNDNRETLDLLVVEIRKLSV